MWELFEDKSKGFKKGNNLGVRFYKNHKIPHPRQFGNKSNMSKFKIHPVNVIFLKMCGWSSSKIAKELGMKHRQQIDSCIKNYIKRVTYYNQDGKKL